MDGFEGWICVAKYDQDYLDSLSGNAPPSFDEHMIITQYGPFDLRLWSPGMELYLESVGALLNGALQ